MARQVRERGEREAAEEQRITRLFQLPAAGPGKERLQKLGLLVLPQRLRGQAAREQMALCATVSGLCLANSLTGLAGCLIGQLNKSCDINLGTGMVTVALASLVIGESLMGRGSIARRVFGVVLGAVLYRLIIAVAISTKIVPTEGFKLVSALIVAVAIATPYGRKMVALQKQKLAAKKKRGGAKVC